MLALISEYLNWNELIHDAIWGFVVLVVGMNIMITVQKIWGSNEPKK